MDRPAAKILRIGAWCVNPASGQISRPGEAVTLESRTMRKGKKIPVPEIAKSLGVVYVLSGSVRESDATAHRGATDSRRERLRDLV